MNESLKILISILGNVWEVVKVWWWLPVPFILLQPFLFLFRWWRTEIFLKNSPSILLEVKIPKEVLKPIRAMEIVLDGLWQIIYDAPGTLHEKWIEAKVILSYSFEIVSIEGEPHFFIRIPKANKEAIEAVIYGQYTSAEISVVEDYTKYIPADIPNKDWDLWGTDYKPLRKSPYPIKTYLEFESEREALEEKRIDPLATLLESMAKIGKGEQLWVQITASPVTNMEVPWVDEGEAIRDELAKRTEKAKKQKTMIMEATDFWVSGTVPGGEVEEKKELLPPEMKLTTGERDIISAIEKKMAKRGFNTNIRFIYLGKKEFFFKPKLRLALSYFSNFATQNLNMLVPYGQPFITKVPKKINPLGNIFRQRKLYLRKRNMFKNYIKRDHPLFPASRKFPSSFVLNTEELATIFHFPGQTSAPAPFMQRIETKKGEAPSGLPVE